MLRVRVVVATTLLLSGIVLPVMAWTPSDEEKSAIAGRIDALLKAIEQSDFEVIFSMIPEKVRILIAEQAGISVETLKAQMAELMAQVMAEVEIEAVSVNLDDAQYLATESEVRYALVPTIIRMKASDMRVETKSHTLVFEEEGTIHLIRVDDLEQIILLRQAYPDFVGVEFPQGSQTVLD